MRWLQTIVMDPLCVKLYGVRFPRWVQMWWPPVSWPEIPEGYIADEGYAAARTQNRSHLRSSRERRAAARLEAGRIPVAA